MDLQRPREISRRNRLGFGILRTLEHVLGNNVLSPQPARRALRYAQDRVRRDILEDLKGYGTGRTLDVPEVHTVDEMVRARREGHPVVIRGVAKAWPCTERWTMEFLADQWGDVPVNMIKDHITDDSPVVGKTTIADVVKDIDGRKPTYARFVPILHRRPDILNDLDMEFCRPVISDDGQVRLWGQKTKKGVPLRSHLFFGEAGGVTKTHCELTSNLFVNIRGVKEWVLIPARFLPALNSPVTRNPGVFGTVFDPTVEDDPEFPLMKYCDIYRFELNSGDVLYVPPFVWHHVRTLTRNVSIGIRWYSWRDAVAQTPLLNLLTILATRPTLYHAIKNAVEYADVHG